MIALLSLCAAAAEDPATVVSRDVLAGAAIGEDTPSAAASRASRAEVPAFYTQAASPSPAAVLLGTSGAQIQRPGTPADLALALGDVFDGQSVSVEASPYWLSAHPGLTLAEHARAGAPTLYRNASVSVATLAGDAGALDLAAGFRTTFWPTPGADQPLGQLRRALDGEDLAASAPANPCLQVIETLEEAAAELTRRRAEALDGDASQAQFEALAQQRDQLRQALAAAISEADRRSIEVQIQAVQAQIVPLEARLDASEDQLWAAFAREWDAKIAAWKVLSAADRDACGALLEARPGFALDIAGGARVRAPDGAAADAAVDGFTAWLAPAWTFAGLRSSVVGLARLSGEDWLGAQALSFDSGARVVHAWDRYALGAEAGYRLPIQSRDPGFWVGLSVDVAVGRGAWFNGAVGAAAPLDAPGSLLSAASVAVDFSEDRAVLPGAVPPLPR